MKHQNQNRPSPFPGQTKPGFSFLCSFYIVVYFVTDACLLLWYLF